MGKLIVIDGVDCSGKETQAKLLYKAIRETRSDCEMISFPRYSEPSCELVREYLNGTFGSKPDDVDPYTASTFYAADRYASYKCEPWGKCYDSGGIVIADRYMTSNIIHQAPKFKASDERQEFVTWLACLEYVHNRIPVPDMVIYLDMPFEILTKLLVERAKADGTENKLDIHEGNFEYLKRCRLINTSINNKFKLWDTINCADATGRLKSIDEIHDAIMARVNTIL